MGIVCDAGEGSPAGCGFALVHVEFPPKAIHESAPSVVHDSITDPLYNTLLLSDPAFAVNAK